MTTWAMDAFSSAHFCVEVVLRHKPSHLFCEICQHKELLRGSRSCVPLCADPRLLTGQLCGLVTFSEVWGEEGEVEGGKVRLPLISPLSHMAECVGKHCSRSLHVCTHDWFRDSGDMCDSHQVMQAEGCRSLRCITTITQMMRTAADIRGTQQVPFLPLDLTSWLSCSLRNEPNLCDKCETVHGWKVFITILLCFK